jgi:glycosyltransferase involved in cell wall biosynthesis
MNGAVITALNEAETIGALVKALKSQGLAVCVVNNGSTDETEWQARINGAHVISHDYVWEFADSLMDAWKYAISQGWEYIIQIDAGGSHTIDTTMTDFYKRYYDVKIGSRFCGERAHYIGGSWWRKLGSRIVAHALNFATHQRITDWSSGYRCFSCKALQALVGVPYLTKGHTWQIEVLHAALRKGLTVTEAPITYHAGRSTFKMKMIDDLIKVYLYIFFALPK